MRISDWSSDVCSSDLLKDGKCVRLLRGDMGQVTVFNEDPAAQARTFVEQGFEWQHRVDLNGAVEGHPVNGEAVSRILDAVTIPVQLGGGIRDMDTVAMCREQRVRRSILGSVAVGAPAFVRAGSRRSRGRQAE